MIRLRQIKVSVDSDIDILRKKCAQKLKINLDNIKDIKIKIS